MNNRYLVGAYIRLSKEDKNLNNKDSESIKNQKEIIRKYIEENNYKLIEEFVDDGYTGSNFNRPGFIRMIEKIKNNEINMVIVKDLSRLGRNNIETNEYIDRFFPKYKVRFISILDNVDTEIDSIGNEMIPFKILMNEYYNRITSKSIRASLKSKKQNGLFLGWKAPFGYKKDKKDKNRIVIDKKAANIVKEIYRLRENGYSTIEIKNILDDKKIPTPSVYSNMKNKTLKWSQFTINEILKNETYIGNLIQGKRKKIFGLKSEIKNPKENWIIVNNTHKPIVSKETFNYVNSIKKKITNKCSNFYLLKKMMRCKECGYSIGVIKNKKRKQMYTSCTNYQKNSKKCFPHCMNYYKFEEIIIDTIKTILKDNLDNNKYEIIINNGIKRELLLLLIDKIIIDKDKNIEIYFSFKL